MMQTRLFPAVMLYLKDLKPLCASPGPCITVMLPAFHPGAQALPYTTQLKAAARAAEAELLKQNSREEAEALLAPIRELAEDPEMSEGGKDTVIFRSSRLFRRFSLPEPVGARTVVGQYFHVVPFLGQLCAEREFYILGLSQKHVQLLHYLNGECQPVPLAPGVPKSVEEAGSFDAPDHMLRNRSAAGKSAGAMSGVPFGTGAEREKSNERLHHFFRLVDQSISAVLQGRPLLISGVSQEVAIYRRASAYPGLLEDHLEKDVHLLSEQEIARLAREIARVQPRRRAEKQLQQLRNMAGTERTSTDLRLIFSAAGEGRVAKLILSEGAEYAATREALESDSQEDLLNAAAVLSIRNGSEVFLLPAETMAAEAPVAAMFRY